MKRSKKIKPLRRKKGPRITPAFADKRSSDDKTALLSFETFNAKAERASTWDKGDIDSLFRTFEHLAQMTWSQIHQTAGTKKKTGLCYTSFKTPPFNVDWLAKDEHVSSMRVTRKARIFGVKRDQVYLVIRLDRNHEVCS